MRIVVLWLAIICCTDKPESAPPDGSRQASLSFSGLDSEFRHNETFTVQVTVDGELSSISDARQELTIVLSQRAGAGEWQQVGEQIADNNRAIFDLTLPAGSYSLRAETKGALSLSQESQAFTVGGGGSGDGRLAFTEESYTMKTGDLFDVTVTVRDGDDATVALKLLNADGDEAGMLMQWRSKKEDMQPPGVAITAKVEGGKAVFENLFVVEDAAVDQIQAVLQDEDSEVAAVSKLSSTDTAGNLRVSIGQLCHRDSNQKDISRVLLSISPPPANDTQIITDIYSFNGNSRPTTGLPTIIGKNTAGSGQNLNSFSTGFIDNSTFCYDYEFAIKLNEEKQRAFYHKIRGKNLCKSDCN